jgi:hypothetical protein
MKIYIFTKKSMKIPILFVALLLFTVTSVKAQYGRRRYYQLGIGAEAAISINANTANAYTKGFGGTGSILLPVGLKDALSFSGSIYSFMSDKYKADKVATGMVGYRGSFYLVNDLFYIEPKAGVTVLDSRSGMFTYAGGVGHIFADTWDLSLRYQNSVSQNKARQISFIGLNLSYNFDLW